MIGLLNRKYLILGNTWGRILILPHGKLNRKLVNRKKILRKKFCNYAI